MTYNEKDVEFKTVNGKLFAFEKKRIGVTLPKGTLIRMKQRFDWSKYLKESEQLRCRHDGQWTANQINGVAMGLACENYPWGLHLKMDDTNIRFDNASESFVITMSVEVP